MPRLLLLGLLLSLTVGATSARAQQASASGAAVEFSKAFETPTIGPGSVTTLTFTINNDLLGTPVTDLAFTDTLPVGMTIADPARATTTCPSSEGGLTATLSAPGGGGTITFSEGGLGATSSCTVSVDVTSATPGEHTNTSGPLTGSFGTGGTASALLTVSTSLPGFSKSFAPTAVVQGGRSTLTFTFDNTANPSRVGDLDFTDPLPSGLVVATPSNATTDCIAASAPNTTLTAAPGSSTIVLDARGSDFFAGLEVLTAEGTCTVSVDVVATSIGELVNVSGIFHADFVDAGRASAVLTSVSGGALSLTKSFLENPVVPGGTTTLQFTLRNNSRTESATGLTFTDDLSVLPGLAATGTPLSDVCGAGSTLSGTTDLTLSGGSLAPEETCTFDVTLQVPPGATPGTYVNTTSGVSGTVGGDGVAGAAASASLFVAYLPIFTKEFTDDPVSPGDDVTLEFTITNTSPADPVTDLEFEDELTTFLPYPTTVTGTGPDVCGSGSTLSKVFINTDREGLLLTNGNLPGGGSCTFSVTITIPDGFPNGTYTNTTTEITGTVGGTAVTGPAATDDLVVVAAPLLAKSFTPASVHPGTSTVLQFTLSHSLSAPDDATGITFTDDLTAVVAGLAPSAGQLPLAACGGTLDLQSGFFGGSLVLEFAGGSLAPGEDCSFEVTLDVPSSAAYGTFTNTTAAGTATVDGLDISIAPATADLVVTPFKFLKRFLDMNRPGGSPVLVYAIGNTNTAFDATSLMFSDDLAAVLSGMTIGSTPTDPCGTGSSLSGDGGSFLVLSGGTLAPGASCVFAVPLVLPDTPDPGDYSGTSSTLSGTIDGSSVTAPGASASFSLGSRLPQFSKAFSPATILVNEVSRLTFTIDNAAQVVPAEDFGFGDELPAGVVVASTPNASKTCTGGMLTGTPMGSSLTGGETALYFDGGEAPAQGACTISVDVTAAAAGSYLNETSELWSSIGTSDAATATLVVVDPLVYATKVVTFTDDADNDGKADPGDVLHYSVTITSRTADALDNVTFTDTPGANSTLVGGSVTAIPGTITSGDQPTDTDVAVTLGTLAGMGSATVVFDVTVNDPLAESVGSICNQGSVRGSSFTVETDDPDSPAFNDPSCVEVERPAVDVEITSHTSPTRGETLQVYASAENTTDARVTYRRRLFLVHPDGRRVSFSAGREYLDAGALAPASLVQPGIPIAADAPPGTYTVELKAVVIDPPVLVDTESFEFTLPSLGTVFAEIDLAEVRPGAGPNPFLHRTMLRFPVLEAADVDLRVYDAAGREVAVLVQGQLPRGLHEAEFDGTDRPAGVYLWRLSVDGDVTTGAITLVR